MKHIVNFSFCLSLSILYALPCLCDETLNRKVEKAIDRGAEFLIKAVQGNATGPAGKPVRKWKAVGGYPMGAAAVQLYALMKSDIPHTHPVVKDGLKVLAALPLRKTYSVALYIMAMDAVLKQMQVDAVLGARVSRQQQFELIKKMKTATNWLVNARLKGRGAWNYAVTRGGNGRFDHSNTQFAILGLAVAYTRGLMIPVEVWQEIMDHFVKTQDPKGPEVKQRWKLNEPEEDFSALNHSRTRVVNRAKKEWGKEEEKVFARGWSYQNTKEPDKRPVTFNMTCAGTSSVLIAYQALKRRRGFQGPKKLALEKSVRDGIGKLITYVDGHADWSWGGLGGCFYSLYSLEKVGDISGIEKFGSFDWYTVGAEQLLKLQDKKLGCWGDQKKEGNVNYMTSLALLFLARATDLTFHNRPLVKHITGKTAKGNGKSSREWVYLPSMRLEVPVRRIFRKLRYLPTQKLLRMALAIVKNYDNEYTPELIPTLLDTYKKTPFKAVKKVLMRGLVSITGLDSADDKVYTEFMQQWNEIMKAGKQKDISKTSDMLKYLKESPSIILKQKAIWAIMRANARESIGVLIGYMNYEDLSIRKAAYIAVKFLSLKNFPFSPTASSERRKKQIEAWQEWWEKH